MYTINIKEYKREQRNKRIVKVWRGVLAYGIDIALAIALLIGSYLFIWSMYFIFG